MFRIWAKVYREDRIVRQMVYTSQDTFSYDNFYGYLTEICGELDIPTPVLVKAHLFRYAKFHHVVFRPSDYMETVPFEKFVLEHIS